MIYQINCCVNASVGNFSDFSLIRRFRRVNKYTLKVSNSIIFIKLSIQRFRIVNKYTSKV